MDEINHSIPQGFLLPEVRNGFDVTAQMKKVWAVELDLLNKLMSVCDKYHLRYFMDGGTLLGAVRHKGFIPWDDDIDIIMPREDYNKLWDVAEKEFGEPYFFQTALSERNFTRTHAQLRRSDTTGFIELDRHKDINKGIFIDIFVLDNIPRDKRKRTAMKRRLDICKKLMGYRYEVSFSGLSFRQKCIFLAVRSFFAVVPFRTFFNHFNRRVMGGYKDEATSDVGDITLEWRESVIWEREWYDGHVPMQFEHLVLRAPVGYHEILTRQYGDYMQIPADVTAPNGRSHGTVTFDPDMPYKQYFDRIKNDTEETMK